MKKKKVKRFMAALLIIVLLFLTVVCLVCDSKYNIRLTEYEISSEKIPEEFDGFRIVQLSDLHGSGFGRDNQRLADMVIKQQPDMIALTGDFVGDREQLPTFEALLQGISGIAPIYYVNGNHEWAGGCVGEVQSMLEKYGVHYLSNEYLPLEKGGSRIVIAGAEDPNGWADIQNPVDFVGRLRRDCPEDYTVLLGHRNYWVKDYPELPVDLILSGHAHGGIVRLPFVGGLLNTNRSFGAEYESGLYCSGSYCMVVSRGLGNSIVIPRLLNRPELVTVVLRSE